MKAIAIYQCDNQNCQRYEQDRPVPMEEMDGMFFYPTNPICGCQFNEGRTYGALGMRMTDIQVSDHDTPRGFQLDVGDLAGQS